MESKHFHYRSTTRLGRPRMIFSDLWKWRFCRNSLLRKAVQLLKQRVRIGLVGIKHNVKTGSLSFDHIATSGLKSDIIFEFSAPVFLHRRRHFGRATPFSAIFVTPMSTHAQ